jgi:hypothetical protein
MSQKFNFCEVYREIYLMCRMMRHLDDASSGRCVPFRCVLIFWDSPFPRPGRVDQGTQLPRDASGNGPLVLRTEHTKLFFRRHTQTGTPYHITPFLGQNNNISLYSIRDYISSRFHIFLFLMYDVLFCVSIPFPKRAAEISKMHSQLMNS